MPTMTANEKASPLFIASFAKGVALLSSFRGEHTTLSLVDMAEITGLNKSTVQPLAFTLEALVYFPRFAGHKQISVPIALGQRLPMYCSSSGRAFLAALPAASADAILQRSKLQAFTHKTETSSQALRAVIAEAREVGYATSNEQYYIGDLAVAAAIVICQGER